MADRMQHVGHGTGVGVSEPMKKVDIDESYGRMDEWLDGRRDVDLDVDRRTGGGPADCRDCQDVQPKIVSSGPPGP